MNLFCRTKQEELNKENPINFFPNSVNDAGNLTIYSDKNQHCSIVVKDILGKTLHLEEIEILTGKNNFELAFVDYAKRIYFICIKENDQNMKALMVVVE